MARKVLDIALSIGAFLLITYCWLSTMIFILIPWMKSTGGWIIYIITLHIFLLLSYWSFFAAIFTDPGHPPLVANTIEDQSPKTLLLKGRNCSLCSTPTVKPPRTHHCNHGCNRCILKMDHHCPWIANCVGYWNHGHFLRFCTWTWLACLLAEGAILYRTINLIYWPGIVLQGVPMFPLNLVEGLVLIFNCVFLGAVVLILGILTGFTWRNVLTNCTNIEQLEVRNERWDAQQERRLARPFPFNLGSIGQNGDVALGPRRWAWLLPLPSYWQLADQGDGIIFATGDGSDPITWPPFSSDSDAGETHPVTKLEDNKQPVLMVHTGLTSEGDIRYRSKKKGRDYDGELSLPSHLPWHSQTDVRTASP